MRHNTPVGACSTLPGETEAEPPQRLRPAGQPPRPTWQRCRGINRVLSVHFLPPSARESLIPALNSPSHLVDHTAFVGQRVGIQNWRFRLQRSGPHLLSTSFNITGRGENVPRGGSLGEEGGCRCKSCLFQTGTYKVSGASGGRRGESLRLSGNRGQRHSWTIQIIHAI